MTQATTRSGSPSRPRLTKEQRAAKAARDDRAHERYVQRTYGLEPGQYAAMLAAQDGRCAICRKRPRRRRLAVDHNHFTNEPRALLCMLCNKALGLWEFNQETAANAAHYLAAIAAAFPQLPDPLVEPSSPPDRPVHLPPITLNRREPSRSRIQRDPPVASRPGHQPQ